MQALPLLELIPLSGSYMGYPDATFVIVAVLPYTGRLIPASDVVTRNVAVHCQGLIRVLPQVSFFVGAPMACPDVPPVTAKKIAKCVCELP